jgi:hypothetical protein
LAATVGGADVEAGRKGWQALAGAHGNPVTGAPEPSAWKGEGQDVVEQMLVALGWRITGTCQTEETRSVAVTTKDGNGLKFVVTAHNKHTMQELGDSPADAKHTTLAAGDLGHFHPSNLERFARSQSGRQGFSVLGFETAPGGVDNIYQKYKTLHPKLLCEDMPRTYPGAKVLEVYAYYKGEKGTSEADTGTLLRFIEPQEGADLLVLPGFTRVDATFEAFSVPAYSDHWVSNVVSRTGFLDTVNETLGFSCKVDFNAGVVAAGEAQIESSVTGNDPAKTLADKTVALEDQSQVYMPTNNAISEVGHVHTFLQEIGQGVQHVASRVNDLPVLVQRANDYRKMTGAGFSFLSIPRSYYGSLTAKSLSKSAGITMDEASKHCQALKKAGLIDKTDIVALETTREQVVAALPSGVASEVVDCALRGRYSNMYALMGEHLSEETYLKVVRNNILVDVQGDDLLMQIFTAKVMQREAGQEGPFIEFIQRICSERIDPATGKPKPLKPGCGGFGIRNFLTLFLSVEISKSTDARTNA